MTNFNKISQRRYRENDDRASCSYRSQKVYCYIALHIKIPKQHVTTCYLTTIVALQKYRNYLRDNGFLGKRKTRSSETPDDL